MAAAPVATLADAWAASFSAGAAAAHSSRFAELTRLYSEPIRAYHSSVHIVDCFNQLAAVEGKLIWPLAVRQALLFHDSVYDPTAKDNEAKSADLAEAVIREVMPAAGVTAATGTAAAAAAAAPLPRDVDALVAEVRRLIMLTCHGKKPAADDIDGRYLVDIDLSILGRDAEAYDRYDRAIRREYAHVPPADYRAGRSKVLQGFLDAAAGGATIYLTDEFRERYEEAAKANLRRSIAQLADPSRALE